MARTDTLTNFLTDVAAAIKAKKGDETAIPAANFDTEITNLPSGGSSDDLKNFIERDNNFRNFDFPNGITRIGNGVFCKCTNLVNTSLPSGITSIGDYAFYSCTNLSLTSLPSGITSIGGYAFGSCTRLTSITFEGTPQPINSSAFKGCTNLTTINVPWAEGEVGIAPWGAENATINYNYTGR